MCMCVQCVCVANDILYIATAPSVFVMSENERKSLHTNNLLAPGANAADGNQIPPHYHQIILSLILVQLVPWRFEEGRFWALAELNNLGVDDTVMEIWWIDFFI